MSIPDTRWPIYILHDLHITLTQAKNSMKNLTVKSALKISVKINSNNRPQSLAQSSQQRASSLHLTGKKTGQEAYCRFTRSKSHIPIKFAIKVRGLCPLQTPITTLRGKRVPSELNFLQPFFYFLKHFHAFCDAQISILCPSRLQRRGGGQICPNPSLCR